jgi:hypothetical protein
MNSGGGRQWGPLYELLKAVAEKKLIFSAGMLCCKPAESFFFCVLSTPLKRKILQLVVGRFLLHLLKSHGSGVALVFGLWSNWLPELFLLQSHLQTAPAQQQQLEDCFVWAGTYVEETIPEMARSSNNILIRFMLNRLESLTVSALYPVLLNHVPGENLRSRKKLLFKRGRKDS